MRGSGDMDFDSLCFLFTFKGLMSLSLVPDCRIAGFKITYFSIDWLT